MSDLIALICPCCGGKINRNRLTCEFCGTEFELKGGIPYVIEHVQTPVIKISAEARIDRATLRMVGPDDASAILISDIKKKLAESLDEALVMTRKYDPYTETEVITATVRVLKGDYRF